MNSLVDSKHSVYSYSSEMRFACITSF